LKIFDEKHEMAMSAQMMTSMLQGHEQLFHEHIAF
jgi:hypothetical protein